MVLLDHRSPTAVMRVFIVALGTRGDFELFLTLGRALRRRGHCVILGSPAFYATRAREGGVEWIQLGESTREEAVEVLRSLADVRDRVQRIHEFYARWMRPQLSTAMPRIVSTAAGADYFTSNLKMALEPCPCARVTYDPPHAVEDFAKFEAERHGRRILDLVAMPRMLVDPEARWPAAHQFTGFWQGDPRPDWTPPAELLAFLERGAPPVVVTMGSMVMFDVDTFARRIARALRLAGQRGIIVGGWSGISEAPEPADDVLCVGEVPYDWLFPQAACVIHHGGCGTVAAVLRAGKPSILLPQIAAQEDFGRMLARERLATGVLDVHDLAPETLAEAIRVAVTDDRFRQSAQRWQGIVAADGGVEAAVDLIEAHWRELGGRPA